MDTTAQAESTPIEQLDTIGIAGHPRGLSTLFFTEMWERFSYYGMRAILTLFMTAAVADGGLGYKIDSATAVVGWYGFSVYFLGIPGGWVSDRFLGPRLSVLIGGIVIACGHFSMAYPAIFSFYLGLALIAIGTGLLKTNVSTMVGSLYGKNDQRRDGGFSIFYMGINLGAFLAPFVCGFLAQGESFKNFIARFGLSAHSSWHFGFAAAGVGMLLGLTQYTLNKERLLAVGGRPKRKAVDIARQEKTAAPKAEAAKFTPEEWKRIGVIFILFLFSIMFWSIYEQAPTSLNLFADRLTQDRILGIRFPSSWFQALPALFVLIQAPVFSWLWIKLGRREPSSPVKFGYGLFFLSLSMFLMIPASALAASGKVSPLWLIGVYFIQVVGEMCLSPVGMSTYTKLAPPRILGLMMGVWFMSLALGNKLAGFLAGFFPQTSATGVIDTSVLVRLFGYLGLAVLAAAVVLFLLSPKVRKLMGGVH